MRDMLLEQVVRAGHQRQFPVHFLQPSQSEQIQTSGTLYLTEHRLDDRLAQGVNGLTGLGSELAIQPTAGIKICRRPSPRWSRSHAVLLPAGRDVGVEPPLLAGFQVGGAAVAGIHNEGIRQLTGVGLDPLQLEQQVHRIAGLVADADGHDDLVVSIDGSLSILAARCQLHGRSPKQIVIEQPLAKLRREKEMQT
jgi:hypothetical protein